MTPIAAGLFTCGAALPRLIGSQCARCGVVAFPSQPSCPKCTSAKVTERLLARRGTLWSWTVQCFPPKSPPYAVAEPGAFQPYGVGYVELPGEVRVEARLTEADPDRLRIGMPMELTLIPAPGREPGVVTYAFRPVRGQE
ncbi:MAG TPA: OB-fold domain-containing protein [Streptosporangiaceae bacterium]